jgi:hypothetical protein
MESRTLPTVSGLSGIVRLTPARVAALMNMGLVPRLPAAVEQLQRFTPEPAPSGLLEKCFWFGVGDEFAPKAVIGVEVRFDPAYSRWCLEIHEVRATSFFPLRTLARFVADLARAGGYLLTGEVAIGNERMRRFYECVLRGRSVRVDRVRYTCEL